MPVRGRKGLTIREIATTFGLAMTQIQKIRGMEEELEELRKLHQFYLYSDYKSGEIAKYIGVSKRTIQRWLKGVNKPNIKKLRKIRKYLEKKRA